MGRTFLAEGFTNPEMLLLNPCTTMAAMANLLLGVSVQLGLLFAVPAIAAIQPAEQVLITGRKSIDTAEANQQLGSPNDWHPKSAGTGPVRLEQYRRGLEASSLRLATLNKASSQTLQAGSTFHGFRYAMAMNHYFRLRHANENCTEQVAAWNTALNAAKRANIISHLKDLPPHCPLR